MQRKVQLPLEQGQSSQWERSQPAQTSTPLGACFLLQALRGEILGMGPREKVW